ncbi:MAG: SEC-C domain-containing protein [Deltaproteobacteria bacterium]|nr:SEC-C domain-containing protein [Deltaproteobacteria bacterium]
MAEPTQCPCSSGRAYADCCRPYHRDGVEPPTPEALMRSRYSAFALKQVEHLVRTLHPDNADSRRPVDVLKRELKKNCNRFTYPALVVLDARDQDAARDAWVRFRATVLDGSRDCSFTEESRFRRAHGGWRYLDGKVLPPGRDH